jgi:uncharacterized protein
MKKNNIIYNLDEIRKKKVFKENLSIDGESFEECNSYMYKINHVNISVEFATNGRDVIMNGKIKVNMKSICSRCGRDLDLDREEEFYEVYPPTVDEVDIKPLISESIILSQPMKVLCNPQCGKKGE